MKRITVKKGQLSVADAFRRCIVSKSAEGLSSKTISTYKSHFQTLSNYFDTSMNISELDRNVLEDVITSLRKKDLSPNTISSYCRTLRAFLSWARREELTTVFIPPYKQVDTPKEVYTDDELRILLRRPSKNANFCEFRNWVIENFALNCGARASTIRNIKNCDVDLKSKQVVFRHSKNGKLQVMPLCSLMVSILLEYTVIREGDPSDYLFCDQYGRQLSEGALKQAIANYNKSRGIQKTSLHLFRHTFAKKYLLDCHGNAFTLQKLLNHSTLEMTKHYCAIFNADITNDYDRISPLENLNLYSKPIKR